MFLELALACSLRNTCAAGPQVLAEKNEGLAAPPSFNAMFCSACGESLQVSFKFCSKCGKDLANNKEIKVRDETSGKKNLSFKEFKEMKEKQWATFFRKKPGRVKGSGKQQEDLSDIVKINIGIMVPDSGQLRRVHGKSLTVNVPKNATASMLLEAGAENHKAHSKDIIKQEYNYVLLYEDCTEVKTLKESSEAFVLYKYKNECYLVFEEDSEDDLPSMLSSAGTSTSTLNLSTEVASTARAQPFVLSHFSGLTKEFLKCLTCYPSLQVIPKEKKIAILTNFIQLFSSWYFWNCSLDLEIVSFHVQIVLN